jgi:hypothetical protein
LACNSSSDTSLLRNSFCSVKSICRAIDGFPQGLSQRGFKLLIALLQEAKVIMTEY